MKRMLKYVLFTFLLFLMCGINVKASTKYTVCDYEVGKDEKIRLYYQDGSLYYGASANSKGIWKHESKYVTAQQAGFYIGGANKWRYAVTTENGNYKGFDTSIAKISSSCPTIYYYSGGEASGTPSSAKSSATHTFTQKSLTCNYKGLNGTVSWNMSSNFVGVDNILENAPDFVSSKCESKFAGYFPMSGDRLDSTSYSDQTFMYKYLEEASKIGCPRSIIAEGGDAIYSRYSSSWNNYNWNYYITFKLASQNDWKSVNLKGKDSTYTIYSLSCNEEELKSYSEAIESTYNAQVQKLESYKNFDYKNNWKSLKKQQTSCVNKNKKQEFIDCYVTEQTNKVLSDYKTVIKGYNAKKANQTGCDEEALKLDTKENQLIQKVKEVIDYLKKSGAISEETADNLDDSADEALTDITSIKNSLFGNNEFKLKGKKTEEVNCNDIFGSADDETSPMFLIIWIFNILKILIPVLLIILGSIDFGKVVLSNDKEAMSKAISTFVIRIIIAVAIFLLPTLVSLILNILGDAGIISKDVISCVIGEL